MEPPNLFKYDNYRLYLKDWYNWMKQTRPDFSYRAFSRWAGFKSPNQLMLVINGQRNISNKSLDQFTRVLKFKKTERRYFETLIKFNQSKDMAAKKQCLNEISAYWLKRGSFLENEQFKYLTNWYFTAIREMVNLKEFKENGEWITRKLDGLITPAQARLAIRVLLDLGLLNRGKNRRLEQTSQYVTTGNEVAGVGAYLYHMQMIRLAMESLKNKPSRERNVTALSFTLRKQDYENLVEEIHEFRKRIISFLQNRDKQDEDDDLYQLNIHLFPISRV